MSEFPPARLSFNGRSYVLDPDGEASRGVKVAPVPDKPDYPPPDYYPPPGEQDPGSDHPRNRAERIADAATDAMLAHPEYTDDLDTIVIVALPDGGAGLRVSVDHPADALGLLLACARDIARHLGGDIDVMEAPMVPPDGWNEAG